MKVTITGVAKEIPVQTVSIAPNSKDPDNIYLFRCDRCGSAITQVQGIITRMYPGEPTEITPTINHCYKCKKYYSFKPTLVQSTGIHVTLNHSYVDQDFTTFHCVLCRTPLLRYNMYYCKRLPELEMMVTPFTTECLHPTCKQKYLIDDMI